IIAGCRTGYTQQPLIPEVYNAIFQQNLGKLHTIYNKSTEEERQSIEKALYSHLIDLDKFSYENLRDAQLGNGDGFDKILQRHIDVKELEILKEISTKTPEELKLYISTHHGRSDVAAKYLSSIIFSSLDSVSYKELEYLHRTLSSPETKEKLESRKSERYKMIRDAVSTYSRLEYRNTRLLKDLLSIASLQYFNAKFETVARSYSTIGIVPDDPTEIGNQFCQIIKAVFSSKELTIHLNNIISKYCATINSARADFAREADITGYQEMKLSIPDLSNFNYNTDYSILAKIPQARQDFIESRETADTVASIASWFIGSLASSIGQGLYDMYAVEELADKEIAAREEIMTHAYEQLKGKIDNYISTISQSITNQALENNEKFINYVNNYK
ncbi:MAG: hypothetical protein K2M94_04070, partial [Paramuribaculum sp.]|nr:hypothetical protein [Paramuribaculum sp.]